MRYNVITFCVLVVLFFVRPPSLINHGWAVPKGSRLLPWGHPRWLVQKDLVAESAKSFSPVPGRGTRG